MNTNKKVTNRRANLSMEIKVEVLGANLKSLGRSFDVYKETNGGKLDDISDSIKEIKSSLEKHIDAENDNIKTMREYVDKKHKECAKSWTEQAVYGMFAFVGIILISVIGYLYNAKQVDNGYDKVVIEKAKGKK